MSQQRCEQLVERYMAGQMGHAEEEDFFIQVAVDDELRRTLKAYRIIDSAIRKEREASMHGHHAARERVASAFLARWQPSAVDDALPVASSAVGTMRHPTAAFSLRWITIGFLLIAGITIVLMEQGVNGITPAVAPAPASSTRPVPDSTSRSTVREEEPAAMPLPVATSPRASSPSPSSPAQRTKEIAGASDSSRTRTLSVSAPARMPAASSADTLADPVIAPILTAPLDSVTRTISPQDTMRLPVRIDWEIR